MITIETKDYILEQSEPCSMMFDLKLSLPVINKQTKQIDRYEFKQVGYGMSIDMCISKIAIHNIEFNDQDVHTIRNLIKEIKEENSRVNKEIKDKFYKILNSRK